MKFDFKNLRILKKSVNTLILSILHKIYFHNKKRCEVKNSAIRNMLLYKFYEFITSRGPIAT